jgi:hypothetical protein
MKAHFEITIKNSVCNHYKEKRGLQSLIKNREGRNLPGKACLEYNQSDRQAVVEYQILSIPTSTTIMWQGCFSNTFLKPFLYIKKEG